MAAEQSTRDGIAHTNPGVAAADDGFDPRWLGASIAIDHWHFHRQLLKRYSLVLGPGDFSAMRRAIEDGAAPAIDWRQGDKAIYWVRVPSLHTRIYVLVANGRNLVTAWPPSRKLTVLRKELEQRRKAAATAAGPA